MPPTKPIPVRLDDGIIARLDTAAKRMGTNRAALIRFLVQTFTASFEKRGQLASLPHNWEDIMRSLDGRTTEPTLLAAEGPPPATPLKKIRDEKYVAKKPTRRRP